jgi:hypothetical protein
MDEIHSGEGAVPSVPNETALPEGSAFASVLPTALPGQRTAMRLLDVVDQLARHMQMLERRGGAQPVVGNASGGPSGVEFLNLQRENAALRTRQKEAKRRLEVLLQRVELARNTEMTNVDAGETLTKTLAQVAEGSR